MVVIVPDNLTTTDTTVLWLGSGGNNDDLPDFSDIGNDYELLIAGGIATANNIVTSIVFQVLTSVASSLALVFRYRTRGLCLPRTLSRVPAARTPASHSPGHSTFLSMF